MEVENPSQENPVANRGKGNQTIIDAELKGTLEIM